MTQKTSKQKVLILKGLQASGKSKFAKELCENEKTWVRSNKDDIRAMLASKHSQENEDLVLKIRDGLIIDAIKSGKNVVVDDTNFSPKHISKIKSIVETLAHDYDVEVEIKEFDVPVEVCIERDSLRQNPVGSKVIWDTYRKYIKPINELPIDTELTKCYIFDIDGTLAHADNRGIYDYEKVNTDRLNQYVKYILDILSKDHEIIICSGRDDACLEQTKEWLDNHGIKYSHIFMRKTGDKRKDCIIKKEIFEENIKGKYQVMGVFDDRNQVVNMWREEGLKVFQVAEGDF